MLLCMNIQRKTIIGRSNNPGVNCNVIIATNISNIINPLKTTSTSNRCFKNRFEYEKDFFSDAAMCSSSIGFMSKR